MTVTWNGRLQPGFRRTADSLSCTRSAVPRSIRAPGTASPRRWASMPRGRSAPIPRCSIRPPSSRENAQSIPRILAESSLRGRESTRPMRWTAVLLAFVLALPAAVALIRLTPTEHWETPPDVGPLLMPPNPTMGTWPPYLRRQAPGPMPIPAQTTGVARIVVLLIDFTDIAHDPSHDGPYFDARMNAAGSSAHSVGSYYQEVSRGALTVNATVIPMWFHSTHPMSDYGADSATGVDDANGPIYRLVTEAVRAADATVNFAQFDTNGDGVVDHLMAVHAGAAQEPTPAQVGAAIDSIETSGKVFRLSLPGTTSEYFLIENRQPIGFDAALLGTGLLIWHVDDSQTSNDQDNHRLLDLEEADEGVSGDRPTDSGDPWHDTAAGWGPDTTPDSRGYDGSVTGWRIRDISASAATMTATLAHDVTKDLAVSAIRVPFMEAAGTIIRTEVDVRNEGVQAADVTLQVEVYRDSFQSSARVTATTFNRVGLAAQTTATFPLNFTPVSTGRYLVHALVVGAKDEIPSHDERVAHVLVNSFLFRDPVADPGGWTTNGFSNDPDRWRVVNETDPDGAAHSRPSAWRFGYVATLLPNPLPPVWHMLTSSAISVTPGSTFLIFYHRYDLTGRTVEILPVTANDTDEAYVEVSYGGGPWIKLLRYTGRDLSWQGASLNLTANITGPMTLQVRFNASSNVMGKAGGWWIDDVMIASLGLGRAALLLGSVGPFEAPAGATAHIALKLANVGDYETDFRLDAILPAGWDANLEGGSSGLLRGRVVRLGPDNDAALRIALTVAANATVGATYSTVISASAVADPTAKVSLTIQVKASSGFPWELVVAVGSFAAAIVVLAAVVVLRRRRRPRT